MRLIIAGAVLSTLAACGGTYGSKLPFPAGLYAEQPGDRQKWELLSLEEQQRALSFLSIGSTVNSSLFGD